MIQVMQYKMGFKGVCLNLMRTHNLCFEQKQENIRNFRLEIDIFAAEQKPTEYR